MENIFPNNYLQYGALGIVLFQTTIFLIIFKAILTKLKSTSSNGCSHDMMELFKDVVISNTKAITTLANTQRELKDAIYLALKK